MEREQKRRRKVPEPKEGACHFWINKKQRYCRWPVCKEDDRFCVNHSSHTNRIKCPLDPKHNVLRCNLKQHLLVCNKTKEATSQHNLKCYEHDANSSPTKEPMKPVRLSDYSEQDINCVIVKVKALQPLPIEPLSPTPTTSTPANLSRRKLKHLTQQDAIVDSLCTHGFNNNTCFVEMGGKQRTCSVSHTSKTHTSLQRWTFVSSTQSDFIFKKHISRLNRSRNCETKGRPKTRKDGGFMGTCTDRHSTFKVRKYCKSE